MQRTMNHFDRTMLLPLKGLRLTPRFPELGGAYFSRVRPEAVAAPRLLHFNANAAALIDLDPAVAQSPDFVEVFAGARTLQDYPPIATVYAGHQFGVFVPQLGDGRAILIGEVRNARGEIWELQLKGAGRTPYSRFADGRAVLRSSIREYLCSEAMHALGIPGTRALCLIGSTEPVQRETRETAAVICRMAPTHVRFGHFEYFYYQNRHDALQPLADLVIDEHFPQLTGAQNRYAAWLTEVVERSARLIAQWQAVGFCHGVMNTDNMSILGLTLDYGPFGFLDGFDASHICNHSDEAGRYAYDQQPAVAHWNCSRLLQATLPLLSQTPEEAVEIATAILDRFPPAYTSAMLVYWRAKFGLQHPRDDDSALINRFLSLLNHGHSDFSRSFRGLADVSTADDAPPPAIRDYVHDVEAFDAWLADYRARLVPEGVPDAERRARMNAINPKYVLRNYLLQRAIERAEAGDLSEVDRLFRLVQHPCDEQPEMEAYAAEPPPEAQHIAVSCSS